MSSWTNTVHPIPLLILDPSLVSCVRQRITYKLSTLTFRFRSFHCLAPSYLSHLVQPNTPTRSLRSSGSNLVNVPLSSFLHANKSFRFAIPTVWNNLPLVVWSETNYDTFCTETKTLFFRQAFSYTTLSPVP